MTSSLHWFRFWVTCCWLLAACASHPSRPPQQASPSQAQPSSEPQTAAAHGSSEPVGIEADPLEPGEGQPLVLWSVEQGGVLRGYLHGSVHVLPGSEVGHQPRIEAAYEASDALVVEVDVAALDQRTQLLATQLGMYPAGDSLQSHIPQELLKRVLDEVERYEIPRTAALRMRPWLLALTLTMMGISEEGFSQEHGVDRRFLSAAHRADSGKPIVELETAEGQIRALAELGDREQALFLEESLMHTDSREHLKALLDAWVAGDVPQLATLVYAPLKDDPGLRPLYESLYFTRNRAMAARIAELFMSGKTYFVVVGAGHLVGEENLPALLMKAGFSVRRLRGDATASAAFSAHGG